MPGMGQPGMMPRGLPLRSGTADTTAGGPPSVLGTNEPFTQPGTLSTPAPSLHPPQQSGGICFSCGGQLRPNAKFCTKCGTKQ